MALGLLALAMYISCISHVVCASFSALATRKLADAEANFSGIWALMFIKTYHKSKQCRFIHPSSNVLFIISPVMIDCQCNIGQVITLEAQGSPWLSADNFHGLHRYHRLPNTVLAGILNCISPLIIRNSQKCSV